MVKITFYEEKTLHLGFVDYFLVISFSGCINPGETTEESPEFEVSNLELSPSQIKTGEVTTVVATVTNVGEEAGSHKIDLIVNGEAVDQKNLNIEANDSTEVTFEVTRDQVGEFTIEVGDLSETFEVTEEVQELELTEFEFISEGTGEPVDGAYKPQDEVNMDFTVENFEAENELIDYTVKITVRDPDGEIYGGLNEYTILDQTKEVSEDERYVEIDSWISPSEEGWSVGENTVIFKVTDEVGEKSIEFTKTF